MKRTQEFNKETFRKAYRSYRLAPVALAISAVFLLAGCEEADQSVTMYQNADDCSQANPSQSADCKIAYQKAQEEAVKTAPKYASQADCIAEFGESQCIPVPSATTEQTAQAAQSGQTAQSGGSWMPLMAGYMMGRMMAGGFSQQPLFTSRSASSPANGKFVDASGRNYGAASYGRTATVDKSAFTPKPATTTTTTRGGFGDTVMKQSAATSSAHSSSSTPRSGG